MIAVTGATGFLGGAIARALRERGDPVRALVRRSSNRSRLAGLGIECIEGDVTNGVARAFVGARALVHCAGMLGRPGVSEDAYMLVHAEGTSNVLAAARAAGVERVVHVSSPGILGPTRGRDADEEAPLAPTNAYERSKAAAELIVRAFEHEHGPLTVVVRPEFVYGPGDMHVLGLFRMIARGRFFYIARGDAVCHPTYIDDAVAGILAALDRGVPGRTYHIAGPRPVTIRELAETIARAVGAPAPQRHVPAWTVRLAIRAARPVFRLARRPLPLDETGVDFFTCDRHFSRLRAERELGWAPGVPLDEGVRRAVAWYRQRGLIAS